MIRFLQSYDKSVHEQFVAVVDKAIETLPFTLSFPISRAQEQFGKGGYAAMMNHILDFFEIATQYSASVLFKILENSRREPAVEKVLRSVVLKIDRKRPLSFGDWVNDIFTPLALCAAKFCGEHPFVQSIAENVCSRRKNVLLGGKGEQSIVQIRNEYRGHSTTLSDEIYRDVSKAIELRLLAFITALTPLSEYVAMAVDSSGRNFLMNGSAGAVPAEGVDWADACPMHYYLAGSGGECIDLYPFVFFSDDRFVYLFQSLKDESVCYISSDVNALTLVTEVHNEYFDRYFQRIVASFDIAKDYNWEEYRSMLQSESQQFLGEVYKDKKYNNELFVERDCLSDALREFLSGDKSLFPLQGEAGQGKTSQLCFWTEKLLERDKAVLIFSSSDFGSMNLEMHLKRVLGYSGRKGIDKILSAMHGCAERSESVVYFFFDALNECLHYHGNDAVAEAPLALFEDIYKLLVRREYPRFKVLFTCRTYTWKNLLQRHIKGREDLIFNADGDVRYSVRGFTSDETLRAYEIYRQLYQMATPYEMVDKRVAIRLKDPLVMKFVSTNYLGCELSSVASHYTSVSLFGGMLEDISNSYAGNRQCIIMNALADYMLDSYLRGEPMGSVPMELLREALHDAGSELHPLAGLIFKNDGVSIAYAELLNKAERPILRENRHADDSSPSVQFVYERFFEYMLALAFLRRNNGEVSAQTFVDTLKEVIPDVVMMGCLRNVLIMYGNMHPDNEVLLELAAYHSDDYNIMQLITDTLDTMISENFEDELFALFDKLLAFNIPEGKQLVAQFNDVIARIQGNSADDAVIAAHKRLSAQLAPVVKLRNLASVGIINGVLLTDYFNENLYSHDALSVVWRLMTDDLTDVRNDVCMYCYYLSNRTRTSGYSPLRCNLSELIVGEMYAIIKSKPLFYNLLVPRLRKQSIVFLETATRLCTLLVIDALTVQNNREFGVALFGQITGIIRYFSLNLNLIRAFLPFLQIVMRRQITFQSMYVNNALEYQGFWSEEVVPAEAPSDKWSHNLYSQVISFIGHYNRYAAIADSDEKRADEERFRKLMPGILDAYTIGDSFSYFALERVLVIMGCSNWENVKDVVNEFFTDKFRSTEWFDYSQMSMLYVMYQLSVHSKETARKLLPLYERECEDWTVRCRGLFKARNSAKANPTGVYKRNVLNWYCVVYCVCAGDGAALGDDERCVPLAYRLVDKAIADGDKELLYHVVENISELITDFGYVNTALDLVKYIMQKFTTADAVAGFDAMSVDRAGCYGYPMVRLFGDLLGTAKNYFPDEVNTFIKRDLTGLAFPGVSAYRDEILSYNPSGETLSDLLTHKFGNFLMWALLNEKPVDDFAIDAMNAAVGAKDSFGWYDKVVRILLRHMFGLQL